jgi:hypothetical protein
MPEVHEGGCLCGTVRYRVTGTPIRTNVCHCTFCQRRTGSAFGFIAYFKQEDVEITRGILKAYEHRSDESNRRLQMEFCPTCGTTVTLTVEALPGARGVAGGTFDDPSWLKIERFSWMRSAQPWVIVPPGVPQFPKSSLPQPLQTK